MSKRGHAPRWWEAKSKPGSDDEGGTVQTVASDEELEAETPEEHGDTDLPRPTDIFIACMGVTGSGKSSFVSMCCGKQVKIGHDLNSCTSVVQVHSFKLSPNQTVYLIDTPGFDDTDISDTEVLRAIAHWLNESYKKKVLLRGILYFHRITDVRMTGSAKKNILMFKKLCGNNALQNVALVTSMWDQVLKEDGGRREKQLIETPQYWGYMVSKGSITLRHDNTVASALAIVRRLADGEGDPVKLDVQDEMIDRQKLLDQTEAWQELEAARIEEHKKWETKQRENEKQLEKQLREEMRQALRAKDEQSLKELREMKEELKEEYAREQAQRLAKLDQERTRARVDAATLHQQRVGEMATSWQTQGSVATPTPATPTPTMSSTTPTTLSMPPAWTRPWGMTLDRNRSFLAFHLLLERDQNGVWLPPSYHMTSNIDPSQSDLAAAIPSSLPLRPVARQQQRHQVQSFHNQTRPPIRPNVQFPTWPNPQPPNYQVPPYWGPPYGPFGHPQVHPPRRDPRTPRRQHMIPGPPQDGNYQYR